jgi:hypothetical protein
MADVTVVSIEEMEPIYEGLARRARATLGVTSFGMQVLEGRLDRILLRLARANGQPALAAYAQQDDARRYGAYGFMVFAIENDRIAGITGFPQRPDLFERVGLPVEIVG